MGNCISKFNDKPFNLHTPPLTSRHLKKVASGMRKNPVKRILPWDHIKSMGMKDLHKELKVVL